MKQKSQAKPSEQVGVRHFLEFMYDGQPEWSLFAIKAPAEEVSEEWVDFRGAKAVHRDVSIKAGGEADVASSVVAVVQVRNSPWAVIYRSVLYLNEAHLDAVAEEAKEFSARLNTRAITFIGEDTSGANSYQIFEKGKSVEEAEWEVGGEFFKFKSSRRKRPEMEKVTDEFVDSIFREEGIYLPACYPMEEEEAFSLAVEKTSADSIEKADIIEPEDAEDEGDEGEADEDEDEGY
jgi:hypothetical protein